MKTYSEEIYGKSTLPCDMKVIYTQVKSTINRLQFRRRKEHNVEKYAK